MKPFIFLLLIAASLHSDPWEGHDPNLCEVLQEEIDPSYFNLNHMAQDFCVDAWEITIPGYPLAFNPGIIRWRNSYLLSFRIRDEKGVSTLQMGLVWLDENFKPKALPQLLDVPLVAPGSLVKYQDPRLIDVDGRLYIIYSNILDREPGTRELRRMFYAELTYDGSSFTAINPECLLNFDGESPQRWEKNWAPFSYEGRLLFTHGLLPHKIFSHNPAMNCCEMVANTRSKIDWSWGVLRGGTPALLDNGKYLAFFHTCKNLTTAQSKGKNITHYFFGAYTFSPQPPFEITHISPQPIVHKSFYSGYPHNTWKPLRVVFPCGYVSDEKYIYIAYGRQDHECWIAKLDKKKLLDSLVPVSVL